MDKKFIKKIINITKKDTVLRTLFLLISIFLILIIIFLAFSSSYKGKINNNLKNIDLNIKTLSQLEQIIAVDQVNNINEEIALNKKFANYNQVVPFITYLEDLFSIIDPNAVILVKSLESQIFSDHFADYTITFKVNDNMESMFSILDILYKSEYILKLINFKMDYEQLETEEKTINYLSEVYIKIRLYLN